MIAAKAAAHSRQTSGGQYIEVELAAAVPE